MPKSPDAFRTISEVADWLGIQAHVLRFWESKFTQVKPIKRAGGRRYYRPADMLLLGGIKRLLHEDGLTIKGVQKILREEGMNHVAALSEPLDDATSAQMDDSTTQAAPIAEPSPEPEEKGVVLSFEAPPTDLPDASPPVDLDAALPADVEAVEEASAPVEEVTEPLVPIQDSAEHTPAPVDEIMQDAPAAAAEELPQAVDPEPLPADVGEAAQTPPQPAAQMAADDPVPVAEPSTAIEDTPMTPPVEVEAETVTEDIPPSAPPVAAPAPEAAPEPETPQPAQEAATAAPEADPAPTAEDEPEVEANLPAFLRRPLTPEAETPAPTDNPAPQAAQPELEPAHTPEPEAAPAPKPKPRMVTLPLPEESDFEVSKAALSQAYRLRDAAPAKADEIKPLLARLTTLRDAMAAVRRGADTSAPKD